MNRVWRDEWLVIWRHNYHIQLRFSELLGYASFLSIIGCRIPGCEIAVCPVMAASAFQPSPQAESADSECFYTRTYSLLIAKRSPDAFFFVRVSPGLINVIGERWKCCQAPRCHPTLLNKWTELIVCLWFEILITLDIWGRQLKSPFGTNMQRCCRGFISPRRPNHRASGRNSFPKCRGYISRTLM